MEQILSAFSASLATVVERAGRLAVGLEARPRIGSSGVLWRDGVVVTAEHAVRRDEEVPVILPDGSGRAAALAGRDPGTDIAVLKVDGAPAPEFERATRLKAGELVLAVGRHEPGVLAAMGIVSTVGGAWRTWRGGQMDSLLRLDIGAYPRSSGSVLVNADGSVAGMLTSGLTRTAPVAVPAATIDRVVDELLAHGRIVRGYLGIGLQPVPLPSVYQRRLEREQRSAVIVLSVDGGGPAETAGFALGDILVELGGRQIGDTDDVQAALEGAVGRELDAVVLRGGEMARVRVRVGEKRR